MRAGQEKEIIQQNEPVRPREIAEKMNVGIGGLEDKRAAEEADEALEAAYKDEDEKVKRPFWKRTRLRYEQDEPAEGDEPAEDDEQDDPDEARPAWAIRDPGEPTAKEIEQHRMTGHIPFRIWCPYCLAAQAKERAHFKSSPPDDGDNGIPQFGLDYGFSCQN